MKPVRVSYNKTAKDLLTALTVFTLGGPEMSIKSADNVCSLRRKGITVRKTIDVLIAALGISQNLPLLSSDIDLESFHQCLKLDNALDPVNPQQ